MPDRPPHAPANRLGGPLPPQERRRDRRRLRPAPPPNAATDHVSEVLIRVLVVAHFRQQILSDRHDSLGGPWVVDGAHLSYRFSTIRIFSTPIDWIGASSSTL